MVHERPHQLAPDTAISSKLGGGSFKVLLQHNCSPVVERMSERSRRTYPFQAVIVERKRGKERRACAQRIHRRAIGMTNSMKYRA